LFNWLQEAGGVAESEMLRTFNCGIGMIVCVPESESGRALETLSAHNRGAVDLGVIESTDAGSEPSVHVI
jgi:phosphoribosylformylglycinamidine cyclo-ligase